MGWGGIEKIMDNDFTTEYDYKLQQEWSSMESSSNEIWDEIEMRFGH